MKNFGILLIGILIGLWFGLDGTIVDQATWIQNLAK